MYPIMTGKHYPTMGGNNNPAIDKLQIADSDSAIAKHQNPSTYPHLGTKVSDHHQSGRMGFREKTIGLPRTDCTGV